MKPVSEMAFHQTEEPIYCNLIDEENDLDLDSRLERLRVTATGATSDDVKCQKTTTTTDSHRKDILTTIDEIGDLDFEQELIAEERELEKIGNRSYNSRQLEAQFSPNNLRFHSYKLIKQLDPLSSSRVRESHSEGDLLSHCLLITFDLLSKSFSYFDRVYSIHHHLEHNHRYEAILAQSEVALSVRNRSKIMVVLNRGECLLTIFSRIQ